MRYPNKFNSTFLCSILFFVFACDIALCAIESDNPLFNEINQGYLGVSTDNIDSALAIALGLEKPRGALVTEVIKDSPADKAGIRKDDVILEFDGNSVGSSEELNSFISQTKAGTQISFKIFRNKKEQLIKISVVSKFGNAIIPYKKILDSIVVNPDKSSALYLDTLKLSDDGFYFVKSEKQEKISYPDFLTLFHSVGKVISVLGEGTMTYYYYNNEYELFYIIEINGKKVVFPTLYLKLQNTPDPIIEDRNTELENNKDFKIVTSNLTDNEKGILLNIIQGYIGNIGSVNSLTIYPGYSVFVKYIFPWILHYRKAIRYLSEVNLNMAEYELELLLKIELTDENVDEIKLLGYDLASDEIKNTIRLIRDSYLKDAKAKLIIIKSLQKQVASKENYAKAIEQEKLDKQSAIKLYKEIIEKYDGSEEAAKAKTRIEELTKKVSVETVQRLLTDGDRLFSLKDYENAVKSYRQALEINPSDTAIAEKVKKTEDLFNAGLAEKAQVDKEKKQNQIKMYIDLAKDAYNKKIFDKALEEVQKALVLDPTNPDAKLVKLDIENAIQIQKQKERESEALAHYQTGIGYLSRGRYTLALDELQTALSLNPSLTDAKTKMEQMRKTITVEQIDTIGLAEEIYKPERISLFNATKYPVQYKGKMVKWSGTIKQKINNKYIIQTNEDLQFSMTIINRKQATINFIDGSPIMVIGRVDQLLTFESVLGVQKDILHIEALYVK